MCHWGSAAHCRKLSVPWPGRLHSRRQPQLDGVPEAGNSGCMAFSGPERLRSARCPSGGHGGSSAPTAEAPSQALQCFTSDITPTQHAFAANLARGGPVGCRQPRQEEKDRQQCLAHFMVVVSVVNIVELARGALSAGYSEARMLVGGGSGTPMLHKVRETIHQTY